MNLADSNDGGYAGSGLRRSLQQKEVWVNFKAVGHMRIPFKNGDLLRIPYAEEFFGDNDVFESSGKEQWGLVKDRINRVVNREGEDVEWGLVAE